MEKPEKSESRETGYGNMIKDIQSMYNLEKLSDISKKTTTFYEFGGWRQSKAKTEFVRSAHEIAKERGMPGYQGDREDLGVPLGQRYLAPLKLVGVDAYGEIDDFHDINNAAIQQACDDIKRTSIVSLDMAHRVLEQRIGVTVTPETINHYLECKNHSIAGGALAQEHMAEINPLMTKDSYAKMIVGNKELADQIDKSFLINIEDEFSEDQGGKLTEAIGDHIYQVSRIPTIAVRIADGGITHRWDNTSTSLGLVAAYNLGGGYSAVSDLVIVAKHLQTIQIGTITWPRRARAQNEPGGVPVGYMGDICQTPMGEGSDILKYVFDTIALGAMYYELIWFGGYMAGGIGPTTAVANTFTGIGGLQDMGTPILTNMIKRKYGGLARAEPSFDVVKELTELVCFMFMEGLDRFPVMLEHLWGGAVRQAAVAIASAMLVGLATGNSLAGVIASNYAFCHVMKEAWGRGGFGAADSLEYVMMGNAASLRPEEGNLPELRGPNMSMISLPGHIDSSVAACAAAHGARGDAWVLSPVIKVAFADPNLAFNFKDVRSEVTKGAMREFMPEGDRDPIKPAR
ncbi:MAG: methyl-coenzyme M reductase subunit alpha [Halobacteriota archaeon]|nr:methyl-coenzyme M reductase subunit alpha [Halobacteriota archaeon]